MSEPETTPENETGEPRSATPVMRLVLCEPQLKGPPSFGGCQWDEPAETLLRIERGDEVVEFKQEEVEQIAWFIQRRGMFSGFGRMR